MTKRAFVANAGNIRSGKLLILESDSPDLIIKQEDLAAVIREIRSVLGR